MSDKTRPSCFIVMPVSMPEELLKEYGEDAKHFEHVLEHLFMPALEEVGFRPIPPTITGSELIHAEIVKHLDEADLVLCDMSTRNPNVFFELGIRTALDKPTVMVVDDRTAGKVPFDTHIMNYFSYSSDMHCWEVEDELPRLSEHIRNAVGKGGDRNALWKYFGVSQTGTFDPGSSTVEDKIELVMRELQAMRQEVPQMLSDMAARARTHVPGPSLLDPSAGSHPSAVLTAIQDILGGYAIPPALGLRPRKQEKDGQH